MRVRREFRDTRGHYWRPAAKGYTDDLGEAGLWVAGLSPETDRAEPVAFLVARAHECPSWCVHSFGHTGAHRSQEEVDQRLRTGVLYAEIFRGGGAPPELLAAWDTAGLDRAAELERLAVALEGGDIELLARLHLELP